MRRYPADVLWDEIGYLAYHLHWSFDDLLELEHAHRRRLIQIVAGFERKARSTDTTPA